MENNRILVHGRVQGVGFRASAKQMAEQLGVTGWVKNQPDGTVLIEAEAEEDQLKRFIEKINEGPTPFSQVESLDITSQDEIQGYSRFKVVH